MNHTLVFSTEFEAKLASVSNGTKAVWNGIGITSYNDLMHLSAQKLNEDNDKLNITDVIFESNVGIYDQTNTYFGLIKNEIGTILAYVFAIPPKYATRSGVLAQQVFPVMSGIMPCINNSKDLHITNKPIYIINLNEETLTAAVAVNIVSGQILGFRYTDIYNRDIDQILLSEGISSKVHSISDYDNMIIMNSRNNTNEFFDVDQTNRIVSFQKTRLKDGIHVNNEPYWFVLKAYAALYLAKKAGYSLDISQLNTLSRGNKTLDAFRDYVDKVK